MRKFPRKEEDLLKLAEKLAVSLDSSTTNVGIDRSIIQRRILAILAERRNSSLWKLALFSALASVFSGAAAWYAIVFKCP